MSAHPCANLQAEESIELGQWRAFYRRAEEDMNKELDPSVVHQRWIAFQIWRAANALEGINQSLKDWRLTEAM